MSVPAVSSSVDMSRLLQLSVAMKNLDGAGPDGATYGGVKALDHAKAVVRAGESFAAYA